MSCVESAHQFEKCFPVARLRMAYPVIFGTIEGQHINQAFNSINEWRQK
jgi:hypothetical protein